MDRAVELIEAQSRKCRELGSPFYADLLELIAADAAADGPVAAVLAGHEDDPESAAVPLRLMGSIHYLVLTGQAPEPALHYPSTDGDGDAGAAWIAVRQLLRTHPLEVAAGLRHAPQTNEVGRAAGLFGALLTLVSDDPMPVRLFEIGCSGGLNLRADRFRYRSADNHRWGPLSPVDLNPAWMTLPAESLPVVEVVERRGADLNPIDATDQDGAIRLASYVWADQTERLRRLRGAILIAGQHPAQIETATAADFLDRIELREDQLTVVWHSVMLQYVQAEERTRIAARINELGAAATDNSPFAHISFEPQQLSVTEGAHYLVTATRWPGGEPQILGEAPPHGMPVQWGEPLIDADAASWETS